MKHLKWSSQAMKIIKTKLCNQMSDAVRLGLFCLFSASQKNTAFGFGLNNVHDDIKL